MLLVQQSDNFREEIEATVAQFGSYFQSIDNGPLHSAEIAILKSFLIWKLKIEQCQDPSSADPLPIKG